MNRADLGGEGIMEMHCWVCSTYTWDCIFLMVTSWYFFTGEPKETADQGQELVLVHEIQRQLTVQVTVWVYPIDLIFY